MGKKRNKSKTKKRWTKGLLTGGLLLITLGLFLTPNRKTRVLAYTAAEKTQLQAEDIQVSRSRLLLSAAAHIKRANQTGYGYNRVLNGTSYQPLSTSNQGFCCVDLATHTLYTATASQINQDYHTITETLATAHLYSESNGLVFNTQTVSTLKAQLQALPALYTSLGASVDPASLKLGDLVLMGDKNSSVLNHCVLVMGRITAQENSQLQIPAFNPATSYFINMSSATGATWQSTDRLNKAWNSGDPNKGYFIKAAFRPRFAIRDQDLGGLAFRKTDDQGGGLTGAVFSLQGPDGSQEIITMTSPDYESGKTLKPGTYTLTEVQAPPGYQCDQEPGTLIIQMDSINRRYQTNPLINQPKAVPIQIIKQDQKTGQRIQGAIFEISKDPTFPQDMTESLTTGPDGTAISQALLIGPQERIFLRETYTPPPYIRDPVIRTIDFQVGGTSLIIENCQAQGQIQIIKRDSRDQRPVPGANFELRSPEGNTLASGQTDTQGRLTFSQLPFGVYTIQEVEAPQGYKPNPTIHEVRLIYQDMETPIIESTLSIQNDPATSRIRLLKLAEDNMQALSGALFQILDPEGQPARDADGRQIPILETDEQGTALTPELRMGIYHIREIQAPEGFHPSTQDRIVQLDQDGALLEVTLTNERIRIGVLVRKFDRLTGLPLAGALFQIVTEDGQALFEGGFMTDEEGQALAPEPLPFGSYCLVEICPPLGYTSGPDQDFEIPGQAELFQRQRGTPTLELRADNSPVLLEIHKRSQLTLDNLPGAHLQLLQKNTGQLVDEWVSDKLPHTLSHLPIGSSYILRETKVPDGYRISPDLLFTVQDTEEVQSIELVNELTEILLQKTDAQTRKPLTGASFEIRNQEGDPMPFHLNGETWVFAPLLHQAGQIRIQVDQEGRAHLQGLPEGTYDLVEITAPKGYEPLSENFEIKLDSRQRTCQSYDIPNQSLRAPATGQKLDSSYLLGLLLVTASGLALLLLTMRRKRKKTRHPSRPGGSRYG